MDLMLKFLYNQLNKSRLLDGMKGPSMDDEEEIRSIFGFEESEALLNELNGMEGISSELAKNMQKEMNQVLDNQENILIVGTEGTKTVTIITAPQDVVLKPNGKPTRGPVLIPTLDKNRVVSMVSAEFVEKAARFCGDMEDQDGAQEKWEELLEHFFEKTLDLAEAGGEVLEIPDFIPEEGF
jgi:hypothetical protein